MKTRLSFLVVIFATLITCCGRGRDIIATENQLAATQAGAQALALTQNATNQALEWEQISFDDIAPAGLNMQQCWNALGIDDQGRIYIGFTSYARDGKEDFAVFRFDPKTRQKTLLDTFLGIAAAAGNSQAGENIPKGHTKMIFADSKMYMASQGFHDLKWEIDSLPTYRGSHLFAYDAAANTWQDLSAALPGGVVTEHEGIISLNILPQEHLLVGLAHPSSDIVLYDYQAQKLVKVVPGIPWKLGNPLSREIIVTPAGHIYTYRGTEAVEQRFERHTPWVYDIHTGEMKDTGFSMTNGFWIGKTEKRDGSKIYVSTTGGELYEFDVATETFRDLGYMLPEDQVRAGRYIQYTYAITLSPDETKIYIALSVLANPAGTGELYRYDLASGSLTFVQKLPDGIYTSADVRDNEHIYFSHFGSTTNTWSGNPGLFILHLPSQP